MAGRKRTRKSSDSPNTILVIFLVLFILTTIAGFTWAILLETAGKDGKSWADKAQAAEAKYQGAKNGQNWMRFQALETRAALGDPVMRDDKSSDFGAWKTWRGQFMTDKDELADDSPFKGENLEERKALREIIILNKKELGWDNNAHLYQKSYRDVVAKQAGEVKKAQADSIALLLQKKAIEQEYLSFYAKYEKDRKDIVAELGSLEAKRLADAKNKSAEMLQEIAINRKLLNDNQKIQQDAIVELKKKDDIIKELTDRLMGIGDGPIVKGPQPRDLADPHALLLDISKGKALWDRPRGAILRVNERDKVTIDVGSRHGASLGLTFNVFGKGWDGRAEKHMKGTLEIIKVNELTSVARVTSLFDPEGNEISLADTGPSKYLREANYGMQEGDLLFNLVWGTHVVLAGIMDLDGGQPNGPAAEMDALERTRKTLERQGVIVDGYVDLRDGSLKGGLTPQTAYLIRGSGIFGEGQADDKAPNRAKAVNEAIFALKKEAVDRGMFLISPTNFATVVGYRPARSAIDRAVGTFRPTMPSAGTPLIEGGKEPERDPQKLKDGAPLNR